MQAPGSSSTASTGTSRSEPQHVVVEIPHEPQLTTNALPKRWGLWSPGHRERKLTPTLSPEQIDELQLKREVRRSATYFTVSAVALIGSSIGAGWSINSMQHRPESTATVTTTGLENLLGLSNSDEAGSHSLASSVSVYLSAVFFFIILLSFFATVTFGSQLTLALYARSARSLDVEKQQQHTHAWKRIKAIFQPKSSNVKKPQLPAYEHAVRQAVLKHGTRPGDVYSEFHAITVEEMELERIRKLGGAPPAYPH